ncbi:MAG: TonB-dependent receptor plug domain-containing protein [Syntrophotaleaceae bacterium]
MPSSSNPASSPLQLAPIIVSAPRIPSAIEGVPSAVSVVEMEEVVPGKPLLTLFDPLSRVPGVQVSNRLNFAQDLRVSIRGFGARSAFGIRGIQILVDGLPYTLPDGQSQIDDIDPEAIERIEVLRGPIAALYGNSSGGVINLLTREGSPEPSLEAAIVTGDFGLVKTVLQAGGQADRTSGF